MHRLENVLMVPSGDPSFLAGGAVVLDSATVTIVGPIAAKDQSFRAAVRKPLLQPQDGCIVAVATDAPLLRAQVPVLMLNDVERIANALQAEACSFASRPA